MLKHRYKNYASIPKNTVKNKKGLTDLLEGKRRPQNNFNISPDAIPKKFTPAFDQIEAFSVKTAFDGALYPKEKLSSLVKYLEKRGVNVYGTEGNPKFVGMWDGTGQIYLPKDPTVLQVKHELSHYLDFKNFGVEQYVKLSRYEREALVLYRLEKNRLCPGLNELEKEFSRKYVKDLRPESTLEVNPNE